MGRIRDVFSIKRTNKYIELYFLGKFKGYYNNDSEVEEAKLHILCG